MNIVNKFYSTSDNGPSWLNTSGVITATIEGNGENNNSDG